MRRTRAFGLIVGYLRDSHTVSYTSRGTYTACLRGRDTVFPVPADVHENPRDDMLGTKLRSPSLSCLLLPRPCVLVRSHSNGPHPLHDVESSSQHAAARDRADVAEEPSDVQSQEKESQDSAAGIKSRLLSASLRHVVLSWPEAGCRNCYVLRCLR